MKLTPEQQAMLNGEKGETMAKVVKTLVMYGDAFGAERMVPVTSKYGHTVISFGLKAIKPSMSCTISLSMPASPARRSSPRTRP